VKILEGKLIKSTSVTDRECNHQFGVDYRKSSRAYFHPPGPPETTGPRYNVPLVPPLV